MPTPDVSPAWFIASFQSRITCPSSRGPPWRPSAAPTTTRRLRSLRPARCRTRPRRSVSWTPPERWTLLCATVRREAYGSLTVRPPASTDRSWTMTASAGTSRPWLATSRSRRTPTRLPTRRMSDGRRRRRRAPRLPARPPPTAVPPPPPSRPLRRPVGHAGRATRPPARRHRPASGRVSSCRSRSNSSTRSVAAPTSSPTMRRASADRHRAIASTARTSNGRAASTASAASRHACSPSPRDARIDASAARACGNSHSPPGSSRASSTASSKWTRAAAASPSANASHPR